MKPTPAAAPALGGQVVLVNDGKGLKLIDGTVTVTGDKVLVRQGAIDRPFPKDQVQFVGNSRDEAYRFLAGKLPPADAPARLNLARWCMFNGLREQALESAREVVKLQPGNTAAADMVRSLEESLRQFPADGSAPKPAAPAAPAPGLPAVPPPTGLTPPAPAPAAVEPEPDVTPEAAAVFASRVQPVLANLCADCHAKPTHPGSFKLARTTGYDAGPDTTRQNLRASAAQIKKDDPANSPLLAKALVAHGGMTQPAVAGRTAPPFRLLEAWAFVAVGTAAPAAPPTPTSPPVAAPPATPPTGPLPPPPTDPAPKSALPAVPPPDLKPPTPVAPPMIPPAVTDPNPVPPTIPPAKDALKFGQDAKPTTPSGPDPANTGEPADEFDPSVFNRAVHPAKAGPPTPQK